MDMILKNTFQSISPAYELIGDVTVASNTTQVDFTGLNIGKDDELLLVSEIFNPNTSNGANIRLYYNSNTTTTNYYNQYIRTDATSVAAVRANEAQYTWADENFRNASFTKIKLANSGYIVSQTSSNRKNGTSSLVQGDYYTTSTFTASSITTIRISSSVASAIGTGSRFQLYKLVAEKVADIIVPSNTTSVDITGLDIGKGNEYYLVSDVWNPTGSNHSTYLFVNANLQMTDYYAQRLNVYDTTITSARVNNPNHVTTTSLLKTFATSTIKLTNSGHFIAQINYSRDYSGLIQLRKNYLTSTFNISSITSLTIQADVANSIGANSRFTLYKMK